MNFVFPFWQSKIFDFVLPSTTLCFALHFSWGEKKPVTGRTRHQIIETSRRAVSGMRQVASGKCQCEWQDSVGSALRSEWQRQVQRVALYYAYSQGNNNKNNNSRRNSNRPRSGASSSNLACHLNELNEELINHAHISHSYATKQLAATNQSPPTEQDPEPGHSFTRPSEPRTIHQSINQLPPPLCMWPEMLLSKHLQPIFGSGFKVLVYIRWRVPLANMIDEHVQTLVQSAKLPTGFTSNECRDWCTSWITSAGADDDYDKRVEYVEKRGQRNQ